MERVISSIDGGVTAPLGFRAAGVACGIKTSGALDLALVVADKPATAAGMFTTNKVQAAPVIVSRDHLKRSRGRALAVLINSGCANACTGETGMEVAREMAAEAGRVLVCASERVLVASTGVIGVQLDGDKVARGIAEARKALSRDAHDAAARAIMTTDPSPKACAVEVRVETGTFRVGGMAKGAGMIEPNMATMLVYLVTDAELPKPAMKPMLKRVVDRTFNCMSIDTDTSTSDTVVLMANGLAGQVKLTQFEKGLFQVCEYLTREIARNGEGVTKLITVDVSGAKTSVQAKRVAKLVANSPLVKTAVYGSDPNWGRVIMAVGKSFDPSIDPAKVNIRFGATAVFKKGSPVD
jgi:glutamate N-acetyltransferase / amino-acid N-acetyltransferase